MRYTYKYYTISITVNYIIQLSNCLLTLMFQYKYVCTSVFSLSSEQAPELFSPFALSVNAFLQNSHLGGLTAKVPLGLNKRGHLRCLITQSILFLYTCF